MRSSTGTVVSKETEDRMIQAIKEVNVEEENVEGLIGEGLEEPIDWAWDDVKGETLDPKKVAEARREEVEYMIMKGVWKEVSVDECRNKTGKEPVTVRWVDTEKGSGSETSTRSRRRTCSPPPRHWSC